MLSEEEEDKCQPTNEANAEIRYLIFAERREGRQVSTFSEKNVFSIQYSVNMLSPDGGKNNDVKKLLFRY